MFKIFYPDEWLDSAYKIDYSAFRRSGFCGVIFDIDNTLTRHGEPATSEAVNLFSYLKEIGMKTCLISNNKEPRVKLFAESVGSPYIFKAGKPFRKSYLKGMEIMGTAKDNTLFVGDQLFTDIWGAKRTGIYTVLVNPINPREEIQIVLKRYLEKPVLASYKRNRKRRE